MTHWLGYVLGDAIAIASKEQIIKATVFNGASYGIFWCQDISNRCRSRVMNFIPMGWWRRTGLLKYARRLKWREVWSREKIDSRFNLWMAGMAGWLAGWTLLLSVSRVEAPLPSCSPATCQFLLNGRRGKVALILGLRHLPPSRLEAASVSVSWQFVSDFHGSWY